MSERNSCIDDHHVISCVFLLFICCSAPSLHVKLYESEIMCYTTSSHDPLASDHPTLATPIQHESYIPSETHESSDTSLKLIAFLLPLFSSSPPDLQLTWIDGEGYPVPSEEVVYTRTPMPDGKRENAVLKWTFKPTKDHDGKTFTCRSENPALTQPQKAHIKLEVEVCSDQHQQMNLDV